MINKGGFYRVAMSSMGISSGLSFFAVVTVVSFRLANAGLSANIVGLFAFAGLPYSIRFLWPFFVDRVSIPYFSKHLGNRKSWGIVSCFMSGLLFILLGCFNPLQNVPIFFLIVLMSSLFSAIHDIVADSYRFYFQTELPLEKSVVFQTIGFRSGQFLASSAIPFIACFYSWKVAHLCFVFFKFFSIICMFFLKEPSLDLDPKLIFKKNSKISWCKQLFEIISTALQKKRIQIFLVSLILMRIVDTITSSLQTIFIGEMKISSAQFGIAKSSVGFCSIILGVAAAGFFVNKFKIFKTLLFGVFFQSIASFLSIILSSDLLSKQNLILGVGGVAFFQDFFQGFINTATIIYISKFCKAELGVYHFTLFSAVGSMSRTIFTSLLTILQGFLGWNTIFCIPIFISIPLFFIFSFFSKNDTSEMKN